MPIVRTVVTADGTVTLFAPELNEHYHSVHGAMQESMHVFIRAGLHFAEPKQPLRIFEVGFGTGLNALLSQILKPCPVTYHSIEFFPLEKENIAELNYAENEADKTIFLAIQNAPWNIETTISENFSLKKIKADLHLFKTDEKYDLIYFDAFSPEAQPEMWTAAVFEKMYSLLNPNGILVTYCAKGEVKRTLKASGFEVESIPGPPGKREMTRARRKV